MTSPTDSRGLLGGVRVLDVGEGVSAPYAARTLAWLGADVIKVEPPHGDRARRMAPFAGGVPHPDKSALFLALNAGKRGVTLDLDAPDDRARFLQLARGSQVVIDNRPDGWLAERGLTYETISADTETILCHISPFGDWGPYAGGKAGDLSLFHMSANAHGILGPVEDPNSEPPIRAGGYQSEQVAGMSAVTAILSSLFRMGTTGHGCHIVVSSFEAMATQAIAGLANIAFGGESPTRNLADVREASIGGQVSAIGGVLPCADGYVAISPREDAQWARWLEMMGNPDWAEDPKFATRDARQQNAPELWELLSEWTSQRNKRDIARDGQNRRIPCFPVNTVKDLLEDPHLEARQFFVPIDHPAVGNLRYPGIPYRLSKTKLPIVERPAPTLGQHNDELARAAEPPSAPSFPPSRESRGGDGAAIRPTNPNPAPLEGVRVADFSWIIAGPTATRHLALLGAEVIKVGSARRPDPSTRGSAFHVYNQSKRYAALNLSQQRGKELALDLVAQCDVVVENYAAGVFERLGLGYDVLRKVKPDLIMIASSGTGHTGPDRDYVAYGSLLQHYTGWNSISGYPGSEPIKGGLWADPWVGMELAMITLAALNHRAATGQGQYVDFSMAEALSASLPEALLEYQMNASEPVPLGNGDRNSAPHAAYKCAGNDRWIAIEIHTTEQWRALCQVMGRQDLAADPSLDAPEGRRQREEELNAAISNWTSQRDDIQAFETLQRAGVPCGPSLDMGRLHAEPSLNDGGYLGSVEYPDGTERILPTLPWRVNGRREYTLKPAPELGQDSAYIYEELLGIPTQETEELTDTQIIY